MKVMIKIHHCQNLIPILLVDLSLLMVVAVVEFGDCHSHCFLRNDLVYQMLHLVRRKYQIILLYYHLIQNHLIHLIHLIHDYQMSLECPKVHHFHHFHHCRQRNRHYHDFRMNSKCPITHLKKRD